MYLTLSAKGWSVSISDLHLVACVILCSSWPLKLSGMSGSVLMCNLHWVTRVSLWFCLSRTLSDTGWSMFWHVSSTEWQGLVCALVCLVYWVTQVGLLSGVSRTLSDKGWSVFWCVSYTEWQGLVCVLVCLVHWVTRVGLCSGVPRTLSDNDLSVYLCVSNTECQMKWWTVLWCVSYTK